jgi:hypothetical protein
VVESLVKKIVLDATLPRIIVDENTRVPCAIEEGGETVGSIVGTRKEYEYLARPSGVGTRSERGNVKGFLNVLDLGVNGGRRGRLDDGCKERAIIPCLSAGKWRRAHALIAAWSPRHEGAIVIDVAGGDDLGS